MNKMQKETGKGRVGEQDWSGSAGNIRNLVRMRKTRDDNERDEILINVVKRSECLLNSVKCVSYSESGMNGEPNIDNNELYYYYWVKLSRPKTKPRHLTWSLILLDYIHKLTWKRTQNTVNMH